LICLDTSINAGLRDSADLNLRGCVKYSG